MKKGGTVPGCAASQDAEVPAPPPFLFLLPARRPKNFLNRHPQASQNKTTCDNLPRLK